MAGRELDTRVLHQFHQNQKVSVKITDAPQYFTAFIALNFTKVIIIQ
jgi:hypothetical protein